MVVRAYLWHVSRDTCTVKVTAPYCCGEIILKIQKKSESGLLQNFFFMFINKKILNCYCYIWEYYFFTYILTARGIFLLTMYKIVDSICFSGFSLG